jgi:hypothetical protein
MPRRKQTAEWPANVKQGAYDWRFRNAGFTGKWRYYEFKVVLRSPDELAFSSKNIYNMCKRVAHYINRYMRLGRNEYGVTPHAFSIKEVEEPKT